MKNLFLLTGIAGAGKSTVGENLSDRGYKTLGLDSYPGLCYWGDDNAQPAPDRRMSDPQWLSTFYWRWQPDKIAEIVAGHSGEEPYFLYGRARNQTNFFQLFEAVVLLSVSPATLQGHLRGSGRNHEYGIKHETVEFLLSDVANFQTTALAAGAKAVSAEVSISETTQSVLAACSLAAVNETPGMS